MTHFDRTTSVRPAGSDGSSTHWFEGELDSTWASLVGVHGGYVTSLAVRAAEALLPDRSVRTVSTSFLRPAGAGPVELGLDTVRAGRSFATVAARVRQAGRDIAVCRITMLASTAPGGWTSTLDDRPAPFDRCVPFEPPPSIAHFAQADFRIDPSTVPAADPQAGDARVAGHVRPSETRPVDAAWLTVIGDWFPPSPFRRLVPPSGGISVDYTVHIHRTLPADADRWLEGVFVSADNAGGLALEHGTLTTPEGVPVAETFHTRWTG